MRSRMLALTVTLLICASARAGMPAPLPEQAERIFRVADAPALRLQTLSFFLLVFLLCPLVVKLIWNYIARDFPKLPKLSYGRAFAAVVLWGLLFVVVLTMISGARELMTPGAWRKQGFTYKLTTDATPPLAAEAESETPRRRALESLRTALWQYAATHEGKFPTREQKTAIASNYWLTPNRDEYVYEPGRKAGALSRILAYEPQGPYQRLVLLTNGDIVQLSTVEIVTTLAAEAKP
ncbi:hypothetical protein BH11PLA2_BH11PLA2_17190 [soil metagenome]